MDERATFLSPSSVVKAREDMERNGRKMEREDCSPHLLPSQARGKNEKGVCVLIVAENVDED